MQGSGDLNFQNGTPTSLLSPFYHNLALGKTPSRPLHQVHHFANFLSTLLICHQSVYQNTMLINIGVNMA